MTQYRWITAALHGRWCSTEDEALFDALRSGQALLNIEEGDEVVLKSFVSIEEEPLKHLTWKN